MHLRLKTTLSAPKSQALFQNRITRMQKLHDQKHSVTKDTKLTWFSAYLYINERLINELQSVRKTPVAIKVSL
jgi:hypothetical protein